MNITAEQIEAVGRLADRCDNLIAATRLPMSPQFHLYQLVDQLHVMARELKQLYRDVSGEDAWASDTED
jgi:hypothetical protein